jgi:hypothetical protein
MLRADVFLPLQNAPVPALLSYGIYGKGLAFQQGYPTQWQMLVDARPEVVKGTSSKYMNWETADPEKWVPYGYAVVRIDSRGAGWSEGILDPESPRETLDLYECIEWAAAQPWCSGRVGLLGISYYALIQWRVAPLRPPHLAAMIPWEGRADAYRDALYHGGIYCDFKARWFALQVRSVQHGVGERGARNPNTGELVAGPETLPDSELARNRADQLGEVRRHPLYDEWHVRTNPELAGIEVPFLSAANWGGQGLHSRGNFEGFVQASSPQKWLEVHGGQHWVEFYTDYGVGLQRRFFDHFLRGQDNGWEDTPRVMLNIRRWDGSFVRRAEQDWPIPRTAWTKLYLDAVGMSLRPEPPTTAVRLRYDPAGSAVEFRLAPFTAQTEVTGPLMAKLFVSSDSADADIFVTLRAFRPDGTEITFQGALDAHTPVANGWLRASHRRLDPIRSTPFRPYHTHEVAEPLEPGSVYELDVEIWPTSIVLPPGHWLALSVGGRDYEYQSAAADSTGFAYAGTGVGPFTHTDPDFRPPAVYHAPVTLHTGPDHAGYLLLPVIPGEQEDQDE